VPTDDGTEEESVEEEEEVVAEAEEETGEEDTEQAAVPGIDMGDILQKFGVDTSKIGGLAGAVLSVINLAKNAFSVRANDMQGAEETEEESEDEMA